MSKTPLDVDLVTANFFADAEHEAKYQQQRWPEHHDATKTDADWFWLLGYLLGKAMRPGATTRKRRHRIRAAAAALSLWDQRLADRELDETLMATRQRVRSGTGHKTTDSSGTDGQSCG